MVIETRESFLGRKCRIIEGIAARHGVSLRIQGGIIAPKAVYLRCGAQVGTKVSAVANLAEAFAKGIGAWHVRVYRQGADMTIEVSRLHPDPPWPKRPTPSVTRTAERLGLPVREVASWDLEELKRAQHHMIGG